MPIPAAELFDLARKVETKIATLYEDIANGLPVGSEEARFFARMAGQEHMHAAWVDEMAAGLIEDVMVEELEASEFTNMFQMIDDIHDEVIHEDINVCSALEIILHLEQSTAEDFYRHFPTGIPGVPEALIERMAQSCDDHAATIAEFQKKYACRLPQHLE